MQLPGDCREANSYCKGPEVGVYLGELRTAEASTGDREKEGQVAGVRV